MKILNNRFLLLLFLILVTFFLGLLGYKTYKEYIQYHNNKETIINLQEIDALNKLTDAVGDEALYSALTNQKKVISSDTNVSKARNMTDSRLASLLEQGVNLSRQTSTSLEQIKENLDNARSFLNNHNNNYHKIFYTYYARKVLHGIQESMRATSQLNSTLSDSVNLNAYLHLSKLKAENYAERAIVSDLIQHHRKMTANDYKAWDSLLNYTALPAFGRLTNPILITKLRNIIQPSGFDALGFKERAHIIADGLSGQYTTDISNWISAIDTKNSRLDKAQKHLFSFVKQKREQNLQKNKQNAINYLIQMLVFVLILAFLLYLFYRIAKEKRLLSNTLENIQFDLSQDKKMELERIVNNRDTEKIYAFLAETIKESNQTKDLFLANMSHEIRTPLNGIVGFTQLLKTTPLNEDQEDFVRVIEDSSDNLLVIVNDILDLSKIKAEKIEIEEISFNPLEKFESAVETYGAKALQKDIDFGVYIDPSLPGSIIGDPTRISQVLVNLISNAIKFTGTYGEVSVFCERIHEEDDSITVKFSVKDNGIGISPEQQKRIFEAFSQADSSTTRKFGGTGLGLSISSELVSLMGGKLELESEPGEGSTFYFTLTFVTGSEEMLIERSDFRALRVGLMLPKRNIKRQVDRNLESYIRYLGADFSIYYEDEIFDYHKSELPDLLFVDQRYARREGEIDKILEIDTAIALMASSNNKKQLEALDKQVSSLIYKPLNYSKVLKALKQYMGVQSPQKQETSNADISFTDLKILVAEDNRINQKLITTTLETFGISIDLASNGKEAVMMRKENDYDLIFMDIQMPVMNGMEATQAILDYEKEKKQKHIPIVALTANALKGDREKYLDVGMDDYTPKPINIKLLGQIIQKYCPEKPAESKHIEKQSDNHSAIIVVENAEKKGDDGGSADKDIMIYSNSFSGKLQLSSLEQAGYECVLVNDEDTFLKKLENQKFKFILTDRRLLPDDDCAIIDTIAQQVSRLFFYGGGVASRCKNTDSYETLPELKEKLSLF